jgi:hypothetical protein
MTKEELLILHEVLDWTIPVASMRSHNIYVKAQEAMKIIVKELKENNESS